MAVSTRRIVLINVTTNPTLDWVKQQIRAATAFGDGPRYLIHDNDGIFGQFRERQPCCVSGHSEVEALQLRRPWIH